MKSPDFGYLRPETLDDLFSALARHAEDARILAGGQTLMTLQNMRLSAADVLVDINRLPGLSDIREEADHIVVGALARYAALEESAPVREYAPLLLDALPYIAHPAIRNRGTVGGSLALGDPAAELPACALALDAAMELRSAAGMRLVPAAEFYRGLYETALRPEEILAGLHIPKPPPARVYAFDEVARRRGDFALAGLAVTAEAAGPSLRNIRLAFFGVADRPVLAHAAMAQLEGTPLTDGAIEAARQAVTAELDPPDDPMVPPEYRRHIAGVLTGRLLSRLRESLT